MSTLKWTVDLDAKSGIATLKQFEQAQERSDRKMRQQGATAKGLMSQFKGLEKTLLTLGGVVGGSMIVSAFSRMITNMADLGDSIAKTSTRLGIGTDELQKFHFVAERSGIRVETMNMAMQRMIRRVSEAAIGTGEAQGAIKELGLDAAKLAEMSPDKMFLKITEAMNQVTGSGNRVRLMFKLFDSEGVALKQVMDQGADAVAGLMQEVEDLGGIMDADAIRAAVEYKDEIKNLEAAMLGLKVTVGSEVLPTVIKFTRYLTEAAAGFGMWVADLANETKQAQLRNINTALLDLYDQIDSLREMPEISKIVNKWLGHDVDAEIDALKAKIQELIEKRNQLMAAPPPPTGGGPSGDGGGGGEDFVSRIMSDEERKEKIYAEWRRVHAEFEDEFVSEREQLRREREANELQSRQEYLAMVMGQEMDHLQQRINQQQWAADAENRINMMRATAQQSWMGVAYTAMQIFGARSQKWMLAMIAVETAINVARALIFGHAAVVKALAEVPYPANLAVAAQMEAMMWWNVAAIVAAGALKAFGTATQGGGGGAGTVATPMGPAALVTPTETVGEERGQLIINIEGDFIGDEEWIDRLVERINEAGDKRDVTIRGDTRMYE